LIIYLHIINYIATPSNFRDIQKCYGAKLTRNGTDMGRFYGIAKIQHPLKGAE
jgi:hypothetical protein